MVVGFLAALVAAPHIVGPLAYLGFMVWVLHNSAPRESAPPPNQSEPSESRSAPSEALSTVGGCVLLAVLLSGLPGLLVGALAPDAVVCSGFAFIASLAGGIYMLSARRG